MSDEIVSDIPEQITKMEEEDATANSGRSLESSNKTTGTSDNLDNPEISSPTASSKSGGLPDVGDDDLRKIEEPRAQIEEAQARKIEEPRKVEEPQLPTMETRHREPLDPVRTHMNALILLSLLVVLFTLATEWTYGGQRLLIASVWELSLLICLTCFLWANFLKVAMSARMVFLYLSHGTLLAVIAHLALSPKIGMLTAHLNTHVAAGLLGYALAEHRLFNATEKYDIQMPANKEQAERLRGLRIVAGLYCGLATLGAAAWVVWVACHAADYPTSHLLLFMLVPFPGILLLWISIVAALLRGALMGDNGVALVVFYFGFIMLVFVWSLVALGYTGAAINTWIATLGLSGLFGYSLCVYDSYKEILRIGNRGPSSSPSAEKPLQSTTHESEGSSNDGTAS